MKSLLFTSLMQTFKLFFLGITSLVAVSTLARAEDPVGKAYVYKQVGQRALRVWVLPAQNRSDTKGAPVVVFFHGGGWVSGPVSQFNRQAEYLASRGLTAVQVEYRFVQMNSDEVIAAPIEDARSSIRWLRSHHVLLGIDPSRIAAAGGSAGGHLAAFLGTKDGFDDSADDQNVPSHVAALVLFNPAVDLSPDSSLHKRGGAKFRALSPLFDPQKRCDSVLILTGEADETVPASMLKTFCARLQALKIDCRLIVYPGQKHGFFNLAAHFGPTLVEVDKFFQKLGWLVGPPDLKRIESLPQDPPKWN